MNSDQSISLEALEETRQEIRSLARQIARLSRTEIEPAEFCAEFLGRVVSAMAAVGGALWTVQDGGRPRLQCQINLQQTKIAEKGEENQDRHSRLLRKAFSGGEGLLVPPQGNGGESEQTGNPTDYLLVVAPLKIDLEVVGLLEIFQRPDTSREVQRGHLRFALQMCELAGDYFRSRKLRSLSDRQVLWSQLEEFTRVVDKSPDVRRTAYTIANEGRRLIQCDRVSVAVTRGRRCTVEAISGQDVFEKRSNTVRLLGKLADMVVRTREPIWYTGDTGDVAPQIKEVIQEYVDQAQSKAVGAVPLTRPGAAGDDQESGDEHDRKDEQVVGVLIVERIEDTRFPDSMRQRIDSVCLHGGSALANAREHQNLFLRPVWKTLGKAKWVVKVRTLPKTVLVLVAVTVLTGCLLLWPASVELEVSGTLRPVLRRNIFAGLDGDVEEVFVDHGDRVYRHAILGAEGTSAPGPIWAWFQDDAEDQDDELTLLVVPEGECSFVQGGVQAGHTVRARLPTGSEEETEWTELLVRQVVDRQTLRLERGPAGPMTGPVQIEIWRISPLVRLRNTEVELDVTAVTDRQTTTRQQMHTTQRRLLEESELTQRQRNRLSGQLAELQQELQSLNRKLSLYRRKQRKLLVTVPSDGLVTTWKVGDRLTGCSVRRGKYLMQIADPDGPWQLELRIPEDQVAHVLKSRRELNDQPRVTYILAADPETERRGRVIEIRRTAEVRGEEGNTVLIEVALDDVLSVVQEGQLSGQRHSGAEFKALVYCGKRCLGYVLFHDLIAFVQS